MTLELTVPEAGLATEVDLDGVATDVRTPAVLTAEETFCWTPAADDLVPATGTRPAVARLFFVVTLLAGETTPGRGSGATSPLLAHTWPGWRLL